MSFIPLNYLSQLPASLDAFGRQRVSDPHAIFASKLLYDKLPLLWDDQQVSGGGTSSTFNNNQASVTLAVSNLTAGRRVRQTFKRFLYQPGKSQLVTLTGILGTPAVGITRGLGLFDDSNGLFFQSSPTAINLVIRTFTSGAAVDTLIPQSTWNVDKMNGTGPSGLTLDFSKGQIFFLDYQWLGLGTIAFGFVVNREFHLAHLENHANLTNLVYMSIPNLPLRYEIANSGTGGVASLLVVCNSVLSEGGLEFAGQSFAVSRGSTSLLTLNDADLYPLIAIRLQSTRQAAIVQPSFVSAQILTANANLEMQFLLNPAVAGNPLVYTPVTNSAVEAATGALNTTKVSGGTLLFSSYGTNSAALQIPNPVDVQLGASIAGVSDVLVVAARRITGSTENLYGSLGWRES